LCIIGSSFAGILSQDIELSGDDGEEVLGAKRQTVFRFGFSVFPEKYSQ
jgi:hypothetical protein